eukprot:scaffold63262_cov64-Phaeocystis_antarctica.AAC.3
MSVRCLLNTCANVERSLTSHLRLGARGDQCAHQVLQKTNIIQITLRFYAKIFNRDFKRRLRRRAQPRITHTFTRTLAELLERRADLGFFWDISGAGWGPGKTARD